MRSDVNDAPGALLRIDAHHHLWDLHRTPQTWMVGPQFDPIRQSFNSADYARASAPSQVGASIVVQTVSSVQETSDLLAVAASDQLVCGVVGWVDLTRPDVAEQLARLRDGAGGQHLVGIRHQVHDEPDPNWLTRREVMRGIEAVGNAGLTVDLLVRAAQLPAALQAVAALDEVQFVLDHGAKPDIAGVVHSEENLQWRNLVADLAAFSNVTCKLSGLITEARWSDWSDDVIAPYLHHLVDQFGAHRILAGSDWPVCLLAGSFTDGFELPIRVLQPSQAERSQLMRDNAVAAYRLAV
jgi:L-fuconolactonase